MLRVILSLSFLSIFSTRELKRTRKLAQNPLANQTLRAISLQIVKRRMETSSGALWEVEEILSNTEYAIVVLRDFLAEQTFLGSGGDAPLNLPSDFSVGALQRFGSRSLAYVEKVLAIGANSPTASDTVTRARSDTLLGKALRECVYDTLLGKKLHFPRVPLQGATNLMAQKYRSRWQQHMDNQAV